MNKQLLATTAVCLILGTAAFAQSPSGSSPSSSTQPSTTQQRNDTPSANSSSQDRSSSQPSQSGSSSEQRPSTNSAQSQPANSNANQPSSQKSPSQNSAASQPSSSTPNNSGNNSGNASQAQTTPPAQQGGSSSSPAQAQGNNQQPSNNQAQTNTPPSSNNQAPQSPNAGNANSNNANTSNPNTNNTNTAQQPAQSGRSNTAQSPSTNVNASVNLNDQQRTRVSQSFAHVNVRPLTNVNFSVSVGTVVPRDVHLERVPADVVEIVPQYRNYSYFAVRDEIVIVEPSTMKIVTVLPRSGGSTAAAPASSNRKVSVTDKDREVVRKHTRASTERRTTGSSASTRVEIRRGERVPDMVEIEEFPETVCREAPALREYRYIHRENRTYLVEPTERRVIEKSTSALAPLPQQRRPFAAAFRAFSRRRAGASPVRARGHRRRR